MKSQVTSIELNYTTRCAEFRRNNGKRRSYLAGDESFIRARRLCTLSLKVIGIDSVSINYFNEKQFEEDIGV